MTALSAAGMGAIFGLDRVRALLDSDDAGVHQAPHRASKMIMCNSAVAGTVK